jgi:hypothetical protein
MERKLRFAKYVHQPGTLRLGSVSKQAVRGILKGVAMKFNKIRVLLLCAVIVFAGFCAKTVLADKNSTQNDPAASAVDKGLKWLVAVQGKDGGWGQDGGETSYVRQGEHLESGGNDVANTAVAALALLHTGNTPINGEYHESLQRAVRFIAEHIERSPGEGLAITDLTGTQIQRKLGPYIDTFLASKLLAEIDGNMGDSKANARVRQDLEKCVAKIEKNQLKDGSWNIAGGWAPILGTSMASQSLYVARTKGVAVAQASMNKIEQYSALSAAPPPAATPSPAAAEPAGPASRIAIGGRVDTRTFSGSAGMATMSADASAASAGISLYKKAQEMEQLSRTPEDRKKNHDQIDAIKNQLSDPRFVTGFGSVGGEEFFSYLNISDSLHRAGGPEWERWNGEMKAKILKMQNADGTWAGHHCITGRVAVTSAAILMLVADRENTVTSSPSR